jgi:hypothetical protein
VVWGRTPGVAAMSDTTVFNLKFLCKFRKVTEQQLADFVGVSKSSVAYWKAGRRIISKYWWDICSLLNVDVDAFVYKTLREEHFEEQLSTPKAQYLKSFRLYHDKTLEKVASLSGLELWEVQAIELGDIDGDSKTLERIMTAIQAHA